jgi:hypothetical protein
MDEHDGCDPSLPGHTPRLVATRPLRVGLVAGSTCTTGGRLAGRPREFEIDSTTVRPAHAHLRYRYKNAILRARNAVPLARRRPSPLQRGPPPARGARGAPRAHQERHLSGAKSTEKMQIAPCIFPVHTKLKLVRFRASGVMRQTTCSNVHVLHFARPCRSDGHAPLAS